MAKFSCYAVYNGIEPVTRDRVSKVVSTWNECYALVHGVEDVKYKGFNSVDEATKWINEKAGEKKEEEIKLPDWAENKSDKTELSKSDKFKLDTIKGLMNGITIIAATMENRKYADVISDTIKGISENMKNVSNKLKEL